MSSKLKAYLEGVEQRAKRHADVLDTGGTELALIGSDIERLIQLLRRSVEALDDIALAYRDVQSLAHQHATRVLTDLDALVAGGKG